MITTTHNVAPYRAYGNTSTNINNYILDDYKLSDAARGLLCRLLRLSKTCKLSFSDFYINAPNEQAKQFLIAGFGELIEREYLCPGLIDEFDEEKGLKGNGRFTPLVMYLTPNARHPKLMN